MLVFVPPRIYVGVFETLTIRKLADFQFGNSFGPLWITSSEHIAFIYLSVEDSIIFELGEKKILVLK